MEITNIVVDIPHLHTLHSYLHILVEFLVGHIDHYFDMDQDSHQVAVVFVFRRDHHRVLVLEVVVRDHIHHLVVLVVAGSFFHNLCRNHHIVLFRVNVRVDSLLENSLVVEDPDDRKVRPIQMVRTDVEEFENDSLHHELDVLLESRIDRVSKVIE